MLAFLSEMLMCQNSGNTGKISVPLLYFLEWNSLGSFEHMSAYDLLRSNIFRFSPRSRSEIFVLMSLNLGFWKPTRCTGRWLDSQAFQEQGSSSSDFLTAVEVILG